MCKIGCFWELEEAVESIGKLNQSDGAGLYSVPKGKVWKGSDLKPSDFAPFLTADLLPIMVHGRLCSAGSVCEGNTQPFQHEGIVLAHNGTLSKREMGKALAPPVDWNGETVLDEIRSMSSLSDSALLSKYVGGLTLHDLDEVLMPSSPSNNFMVYHEIERRWLIRGRFALKTVAGKADTLSAVLVNVWNLPLGWQEVSGMICTDQGGQITQNNTVPFRAVTLYAPDEKKWVKKWNKVNEKWEQYQKSQEKKGGTYDYY